MAGKVEIQGHRGARGLLPENTIASCVEALKHGVDAIELDVVISGDNEVLVSHEPWIHHLYCSHPDGRPVTAKESPELAIFGMTVEEVQQYDCGSRGHPNFDEQRPQPAVKPTLADLVTAVDQAAADQGRPAVAYNVELKSRPEWEPRYHPAPARFVELVHGVLERCGVTGRSAMQSFDPRVVNAIRRQDPAITTFLLVENHDSFEANMARLDFVPDGYNPEWVLVTEALIEKVHQQGMRLITWTVNDAADMESLIAMGVDGIITDYPNRAQSCF